MNLKRLIEQNFRYAKAMKPTGMWMFWYAHVKFWLNEALFLSGYVKFLWGYQLFLLGIVKFMLGYALSGDIGSPNHNKASPNQNKQSPNRNNGIAQYNNALYHRIMRIAYHEFYSYKQNIRSSNRIYAGK